MHSQQFEWCGKSFAGVANKKLNSNVQDGVAFTK
jgi:hypothetical protein